MSDRLKVLQERWDQDARNSQKTMLLGQLGLYLLGEAPWAQNLEANAREGKRGGEKREGGPSRWGCTAGQS